MSFIALLIFTICLIEIQFALTNCNNEVDKIFSLPGQPKLNFQQYAGYIVVDDQQQISLFYYFVEAELNPTPKPLVLWLNGGPGCSSVGAGAFIEHGPLKVSGNHLIKNEYSWNKEANMLYLESPAGVGFSFSTNSSFYDYVDDEMTARGNILFLEKWLNKFPEYRNNDFYLTGESYGGHYVPQLADYIIKSEMKINLKGIAIGNPLLEFNTDFNSRAEYFWSHGLISDATYKLLNTVCNISELRRQGQQGHLTPSCTHVFVQYSREIGKFINFYDVTLDVCLPSVQSQSAALNQFQDSSKIDVCIHDETFVYLNREDVRIALHARLVNVKQWSVFTSILHYNMQNLELPMLPILGSLVQSGVRVLIYSGDQDSVLPLTGTRVLIDKLAKELGLNTTVPYSCWFEGKQVAGWNQVYGNILSFVTVRGASHEVPYSQPERSLVLFRSFIGAKI
ncbi:serine protease [Lithospermum erythrorhizon]|uniref:Carboxypeptidase n=1 Tax=Lithospermum erythrorhizon TaxID=34254 RepID=A0AAV3PL78_LITER